MTPIRLPALPRALAALLSLLPLTALGAEEAAVGLLQRGASPLAPETFRAFTEDLAGQTADLVQALQDLMSATGGPITLAAVLAIGFAAGLILRIGAARGIRRLNTGPAHRPSTATAIGFLGALHERAFSLALPVVLLIGLEAHHARDTVAGPVVMLGLALFLGYRGAVGLFPVLVQPGRPLELVSRLRQPPLSRLWRNGRVLLALTLVGVFLAYTEQVVGIPGPVRRETQLLFSLVILAALWRLTHRNLWAPIQRRSGLDPARSILAVGLARGALRLLALLPAVASALGYYRLSSWVLLNLLLTVLILLFAGALAVGLGRAVRRLGRKRPPEALTPMVSSERLERLTGFAGGVVRWVLYLIAAVGVLIAWGFPVERVWAGLRPLLFGFRVGGYELSLIALILAIAVFVATLYIGRWFRRRLREAFLVRFTADPGLRNSIASLAYYAVLVIGVLLAISVAGFDLTNLAIIAGALSVGIGFGLQNVVNNFVSGLILLFERPIKAGDVIDYQGTWAVVQEIRVRSTVVQTYDRSELIVPNSELVSTTVTNWTHSSHLARIILDVGVAYGSDTARVHELLMQAVTEHSQVYSDPAPTVLFRDFGESALNFQVRFFTHLDYYLAAPSDIRYRIDQIFRENDITIPFPQRDVHIHGEESGEEAAGSGEGGGSPTQGDGEPAGEPT